MPTIVLKKNKKNHKIYLWKQIEHLLSLSIFPYLNDSDLIKCVRVSRKWNISSSREQLWYELCKHRQMRIAKINQTSFTNWKQLYCKNKNEQTFLHENKYQKILLFLFGISENKPSCLNKLTIFCTLIIFVFFILFLCDLFTQIHRYEVYHEKLIGNITEWKIEQSQGFITPRYQPIITYQFIYENTNYTRENIFHYTSSEYIFHFLYSKRVYYSSENDAMDVIDTIWNNYSPNQHALNHTNLFCLFKSNQFTYILIS
jgi:hypothetical protein